MNKPAHHRIQQIDFAWPDTPFNVVLVEPQIPPNTGVVARLCAATGTVLHLVGPLGFRLDDRHLRRAGLDYWPAVTIERHPDTATFFEQMADGRHCFLFSTSGARSHYAADFRPGDWLIFGNEPRGLPDAWLQRFPERVLTIPQRPSGVRSLNLATAVAIVLYEALRPTGNPPDTQP